MAKDIFPFFGITDTSLISNYNVTFVVICLLPFLIGLMGLFILKRCTSSNELSEKVVFDDMNEEKEVKRENELDSYDKIKLARFILERIFYEGTFFGLFVGSYLAWISMLYFFRYSNPNTIDIIYALIVIGVWAFQVFSLLKN